MIGHPLAPVHHTADLLQVVNFPSYQHPPEDCHVCTFVHFTQYVGIQWHISSTITDDLMQSQFLLLYCNIPLPQTGFTTTDFSMVSTRYFFEINVPNLIIVVELGGISIPLTVDTEPSEYPVFLVSRNRMNTFAHKLERRLQDLNIFLSIHEFSFLTKINTNTYNWAPLRRINKQTALAGYLHLNGNVNRYILHARVLVGRVWNQKEVHDFTWSEHCNGAKNPLKRHPSMVTTFPLPPNPFLPFPHFLRPLPQPPPRSVRRPKKVYRPRPPTVNSKN